ATFVIGAGFIQSIGHSSSYVPVQSMFRGFHLQLFGLHRSRHIGTAEIVHRIFGRSEEHTSELQSREHLVCRLLLEKKKQPDRRRGQTDPSECKGENQHYQRYPSNYQNITWTR